MKCDICGKRETFVETDWRYCREWFTRHWSQVTFKQFPFNNEENQKQLDLCPTCTKKFKKLLMSVEIEEPGPVVKE